MFADMYFERNFLSFMMPFLVSLVTWWTTNYTSVYEVIIRGCLLAFYANKSHRPSLRHRVSITSLSFLANQSEVSRSLLWYNDVTDSESLRILTMTPFFGTQQAWIHSCWLAIENVHLICVSRHTNLLPPVHNVCAQRSIDRRAKTEAWF